MRKQTQELLEKPSKLWRFFYINRVWLIVFGLLLVTGLYLGYLLFGSNSVEVLLRLQSQKKHLLQEAQVIEAQNAHLQKQIFELKELKP
ncbi:hypothetical protein [Helicobacter hepaticus]|jgi:cell division protein FtsB|uniref:Septum formation initiator n=1 Tax=Helicobacter hepaticus (strain ATCC 51449 / 3B1) TaxID=235279 RepID=Q7VIH5_HELHP|nr:hypothetical protein [Helicobacter hepaticus]AAP77227.1 conserved hypothetical protein [Helicobacter hepaticus ATCC 51449]